MSSNAQWVHVIIEFWLEQNVHISGIYVFVRVTLFTYDIIMLSSVNQGQKGTYYIISLIYGVQKDK